jgi:hypothetical protein
MSIALVIIREKLCHDAFSLYPEIPRPLLQSASQDMVATRSSVSRFRRRQPTASERNDNEKHRKEKDVSPDHTLHPPGSGSEYRL